MSEIYKYPIDIVSSKELSEDSIELIKECLRKIFDSDKYEICINYKINGDIDYIEIAFYPMSIGEKYFSLKITPNIIDCRYISGKAEGFYGSDIRHETDVTYKDLDDGDMIKDIMYKLNIKIFNT